jgi:hypothetical protein
MTVASTILDDLDILVLPNIVNSAIIYTQIFLPASSAGAMR